MHVYVYACVSVHVSMRLHALYQKDSARICLVYRNSHNGPRPWHGQRWTLGAAWHPIGSVVTSHGLTGSAKGRL